MQNLIIECYASKELFEDLYMGFFTSLIKKSISSQSQEQDYYNYLAKIIIMEEGLMPGSNLGDFVQRKITSEEKQQLMVVLQEWLHSLN